MNEKLSENMEMYLKTIHQLAQESGAAKASDIAAIMDVKLASVTNALRKLSQLGLISYEPYSAVELTEKGRNESERLVRNNKVIFEFLSRVLEVEPKTADEEACTMEHYMSAPVLNRLVQFIQHYENAPHPQIKWED